MRRCNVCEQTKPLDEFHRAKRFPGGRSYTCKPCAIEKSRQRRLTNRDLINHQHVLRRYGLSPEKYAQMLEDQGGVCAICRKPESCTSSTGEHIKRLSVDHDHGAGEVRGLLCNNCNRAVGLLGDDPDILARARAYLIRAG